jgi:hypothetical protein
MRKRHRTMAVSLMVAGALLLGWGARAWVRGEQRLDELEARRTAVRADLAENRATLNEVGLRYRGFTSSMAEVPDTLRMYGGNLIDDERRRLQKAIRSGEEAEENYQRALKKVEREEADARARRVREMVPLAAGGALALLTGAWLWPRTRPSLDAA